MQKKSCYGIGVILLGLAAFGLPGPVSAQGAAALADRVQQTYEQAGDLSIDFTQKTYVACLEKEVGKRGKAQFKKPGKLAIRYEGERGRSYLSNGKTLWVFEAGTRRRNPPP